MKNKGFTLAEVLITLTIIGLIATLTIPVFRAIVGSKVSDSQVKTFKMKFDQALQVMQTKGALARTYDSTAEFLNEMNKYANITKICDKNHLSDCFTSKILESKNVIKYNLNNLKSSDDINANFVAELGAVVFNDGTRAIISYNHESTCIVANIYDQTADLTECIAVIYDVNGTEGPNIIGQDIGMYNAGDKTEEDDEFADVEVFSTDYMTKAECNAYKASHSGIKGCVADKDYWIWAVEKCEKEGKRLPRTSELRQLAEKIYGKNSIDNEGTYQGQVVNNRLFNKITDGNSSVTLWGEEVSATYASLRTFEQNQTTAISSYNETGNKDHKNYRAYCVDK